VRLRRLLLGGFVAFALLGAAVAGVWSLGGEAWLARRALESALDRPVEIDGGVEVALGAAPTLRLAGLRVANPGWATAPSFLQVERAEVQIALGPLLRRVVLLPRVALHGVQVDLETAPEGRRNWQLEGAPRSGAPVRLPLVGELSINGVTIAWRDRRDGQKVDLEIARLSAQPDPASGEIRLAADGVLNGHDIVVSGSAGNPEMALAADAPYPLQLELGLPGFDGTLAGTIADVARGAGVDLQLSVRSDSLRAAAKSWRLSVPLDATLQGRARLTGDLAALSLRDLDAEMTTPGGDHLKLTGQLGDVWQGSGLDGDLAFYLDAVGNVRQLLPARWRILEHIKLWSTVAGSVAAPVLKDLRAAIVGPGGSDLKLAGTLGLAADDPLVLESFDLGATLAVPDPAAFSVLLGFDPAPLGPVQGGARLTLADGRVEVSGLNAEASQFGGLAVDAQGLIGTLSAEGGLQITPELSLSAKIDQSAPLLALLNSRAEELGPIQARGRFRRAPEGDRLEDLEIALGEADALSLQAKGSIGPLPASSAGATSVDLAIDVGWLSNRALQPLAGEGLRGLPDLGRAEGQFRLIGSLDELRIEDARLETRRVDGIALVAAGGSATVRPGATSALEGAFDVEVQAPSTTVIARLFGQELPDFGQVRGRGRLSQKEGRVALSAIDLTSGPPVEQAHGGGLRRPAPTIRLTGAIGDLLAFRQVDVRSDFRLPTRPLLAKVDLEPKAELGRVHGDLHLSDADGTMGFDHLTAELRGTDLLRVKVDGLIGDFGRLDEVQLQTRLEVPSPPALAEMLDVDLARLAPLRFEGKLLGHRGGFEADGQAGLGRTEVSGFLSGDLSGARPAFKGQLHSPRVYLADFGLTPLAPLAAQAAGDTQVAPSPSAPGRLFDDRPLPLERLNALDLDLEVQIDAIEGVVLAIDQATARLTLIDGALELSPVRFGSAGGRAEMHAEIDAAPQMPAWRLRALADDAQLGEVWRELETQVPVEGELDLQLDLRARGRSPRALAASLEGALGLAVERGRIQSRLFGLTTKHPLGWLFARSTRHGYSRLDCVIARFDVRGGLAEARTMVVDTPDAIVTGAGSIDFTRETIDLRMQPEAKHRTLVRLATPFTIRGDLAAPSVSVSAAGTAARMVSEVALTPVTLLGSLVSLVSDRGRDADNPCLKVGGG
jgi:uncharacterized protein involved in outer membrane biogenesis